MRGTPGTLIVQNATGAIGLEALESASEMTEQRFELFYKATSPGLRAYVARVLQDPAQADDIVQEAYLRFLRSRPETECPDERRAFLFRVASNLIVDHWRRRRWEQGNPDPRAPAGEGPNIPLRMDLERVFGTLRPKERAMMWLAYVEGADHREIAQAIGVSNRSVRVILYRTRRKLARLLKHLGIETGDR